jgi:hypothetical protein
VAEGEESGTKFKNIDLSDDWCEFDERQNESVRKRGKTDGRWQWCSATYVVDGHQQVGVYNLEHRFTSTK